MPPSDIQVLIPEHGHATLYGKKDSLNVMEVKDLETGRSSWMGCTLSVTTSVPIKGGQREIKLQSKRKHCDYGSRD